MFSSATIRSRSLLNFTVASWILSWGPCVLLQRGRHKFPLSDGLVSGLDAVIVRQVSPRCTAARALFRKLLGECISRFRIRTFPTHLSRSRDAGRTFISDRGVGVTRVSPQRSILIRCLLPWTPRKTYFLQLNARQWNFPIRCNEFHLHGATTPRHLNPLTTLYAGCTMTIDDTVRSRNSSN